MQRSWLLVTVGATVLVACGASDTGNIFGSSGAGGRGEGGASQSSASSSSASSGGAGGGIVTGCIPGTIAPCVCPGGATGTTRCDSTMTYRPCDCGGAAGAGGQGGSSGVGGAAGGGGSGGSGQGGSLPGVCARGGVDCQMADVPGLKHEAWTCVGDPGALQAQAQDCKAMTDDGAGLTTWCCAQPWPPDCIIVWGGCVPSQGEAGPNGYYCLTAAGAPYAGCGLDNSQSPNPDKTSWCCP